MHKEYVIKFKGFYISNEVTKELTTKVEEAHKFSSNSDAIEFLSYLDSKLVENTEVIKYQ